MNTFLSTVAFTLAFLSSPVIRADDAHHGVKEQAVAKTAGTLTNAEVRRVDKAARKITLKHEEIKSLDMPPMTMVFQVSDPAMLDKVKVGDRVKFAAEDLSGAITVTALEIAK